MIAYIYSLSKHLKEGGVINYIFPVFYGLFAYVFINYDFRLISYDSEPDYIANGLLILKNGFPLNSHHPGTMTYYIVSLFLYLAKLMGFGLSNTVIFIRSLFFLIGLFVYLVFNKISRINILICFSLFLVIPGFRLVTNVFSNELLLIPCSFLLLYLLKFKTKRKDLYLSIIFGLMLNLKVASLILLPIIVFNLVNESDSNRHRLYKLFFFISLTYLILILPVFGGFFIPIKGIIVNMIPVWENLYYFIDYKTFSHLQKNIFLVFIVIISFTLALTIIKFKILTFIMNKLKFDESKYLLIILLILIIALVMDFNSEFVRHFIIITPFIVDKIIFKRKELSLVVTIFLPILIFVNIKKPINYNKVLKSDEIINSSLSKIFLYQSSLSSSEISFIEWTKYRYAQSLDIIPNNWYENHAIYNNDGVEYLNTRNYNHQEIKRVSLDKKNTLKILDDPSFNYDKCFIKQIKHIDENKSNIVVFNTDQIIFKKDLKKISEELKTHFEISLISKYKKFNLYTLKIKSIPIHAKICN